MLASLSLVPVLSFDRLQHANAIRVTVCFSENHANPDSGSSSDTEFVPRYDRIAGSRDNFSVFTSNLPGAQNVVTRSTSDEKAPSAMVRTTLPPQRESVGTVLPRAPQLVVTNLNEVSWG